MPFQNKTINYLGIILYKNQEPTDSQIRELMNITKKDYYNCQEDLREASYGPPPSEYSSWLEYFH